MCTQAETQSLYHAIRKLRLQDIGAEFFVECTYGYRGAVRQKINITSIHEHTKTAHYLSFGSSFHDGRHYVRNGQGLTLMDKTI